MAHVELLINNPRANEVRTKAKAIREGMDSLAGHVAAMTQMLTGASSTDASFGVVVSSYEIPGADSAAQLAAAKVLFDEMASAVGNAAAIRQFAAIVG